jgi:hypothetical protein
LNDLLNRHIGSDGDEAPFTKYWIDCIYKTVYSNLLNRHTNTQTMTSCCNIYQDTFCFPQENELLLLWVRMWKIHSVSHKKMNCFSCE